MSKKTKKETPQAFKRAALFTDIHYGKSNNSLQHLEDCSSFIDWFIVEAKKKDAETCIFLGDFFDNRNSIQLRTLDWAYKDLKKLNDNFEKIYFIVGNHDLFYRESREIHSVPYLNEFDNFILIEDIKQVGDCLFVPWLITDEWKKIKNKKTKYVFGHFELPGFMMNAQVKMPENNLLNKDDLKSPEYVFSGHFHKRQKDKNIIYIGNPFPHNYADVDDNERGFVFLEYGKEPEFIDWLDCPKYKIVDLSVLLEHPEKYLDDKTYIKILLDIDITFEEAQVIKDSFQETYNPRKMTLTHKSNMDDSMEIDMEETSFLSVDQIITEGLNSIDASGNIDKLLLLEIYNSLN